MRMASRYFTAHRRGNVSNIKTFSDLLESIAALGLQSTVMDRGFYREENINLEQLGMMVIVGMKQTIWIQTKFLNKIDRDKIYTAINQIEIKRYSCIWARVSIFKGQINKCFIIQKWKFWKETKSESLGFHWIDTCTEGVIFAYVILPTRYLFIILIFIILIFAYLQFLKPDVTKFYLHWGAYMNMYS